MPPAEAFSTTEFETATHLGTVPERDAAQEIGCAGSLSTPVMVLNIFLGSEFSYCSGVRATYSSMGWNRVSGSTMNGPNSANSESRITSGRTTNCGGRHSARVFRRRRP